MGETLEEPSNVSRLIPSTTIGKLLLVKNEQLDGYWVFFHDGRFTLDFRDPREEPIQVDDCYQIEAISKINPKEVDGYVSILEQLEA